METIKVETLYNLQNEGEKEFSKLYDQYSPALYGLIMKWVNDKVLAEIILKNVFVNAWESRRGYDSKKERIFTWLYKMSHNIANHYLES